MQKCSISIPIEGSIWDDIEPIKIDEVLFHMYQYPGSDRRQFFSTVILDGESPEVESKALILIDNALTKLHFTHGLPLSPRRYDIHIFKYPNANVSDSPIIGDKRVSKGLTIWHRIGQDDSKEIILKMQSIKADKKLVFDIALTYYRVAVCSINPYQAIESFFGCVHSIVRDDLKTNNVKQSDLENGLLQVVGSDLVGSHEKFDRFYKSRRSAATHGHVNILDAKNIDEAKKDAYQLKIWVRKLLVSFLDRNQISVP